MKPIVVTFVFDNIDLMVNMGIRERRTVDIILTDEQMQQLTPRAVGISNSKPITDQLTECFINNK